MGAAAAAEALEGRRLLSASLAPRGVVASDPDDQIAEAVAVTLGTPRSGAISATTDVDLYRFTAAAGATLTVTAQTLTPIFPPPPPPLPTGGVPVPVDTATRLDPFLRVFNAQGRQLRFNDDGGPGPGDAQLTLTVPAAGTYYVGVSSFFNGAPVAGTSQAYNPVTGGGDSNPLRKVNTGDYLVSVAVEAPAESPGNNTRATATNLGAVGAETRTINNSVSAADLDDFFRVTVAPNRTLRVDLSGLSQDANVELRSAGGALLARSTAAGTVEESITFDTRAGGTFVVRVFRADRDPARGGSTTYALNLQAAPPDGDDQFAEARTVAVPAAVGGTTALPGRISVDTDVDLFRVTVPAGVRLGFDVDRTGGSLNSFLRVFNGSGQELAASDDAAAPGEDLALDAYVDFTFDAAGTYFVGLSAQPNVAYNPVTGAGDARPGSTGTYNLVVTRLAPDPDDQIAEARTNLVVGGAAVNGILSAATDVDLYRLNLVTGRRYAFDLDSTGVGDSVLRLFNARGEEVAVSDDAPAPGEEPGLDPFISFTPTAAGTYYLGVSGFSNFGYNPFTGAGDTPGATGGYRLFARSAPAAT